VSQQNRERDQATGPISAFCSLKVNHWDEERVEILIQPEAAAPAFSFVSFLRVLWLGLRWGSRSVEHASPGRVLG